MGLTGTPAIVKYLLFVFNLIFLISGIAVITVGADVQSNYNKYYKLLDERFFSVPSLLIATGVIILTISFFGCCGAVKENHCMIITFSVLLILIFILELAAGIAGYILEDVAVNVVSMNLNKTMQIYPNSSEVKALWTGIQKEFTCCGTKGPDDWHAVIKNDSLPLSCCKLDYSSFVSPNCTVHSPEVFTKSCLDAMKDFVVNNAVALGGVGIGIAFVQFLGIVLACCLGHTIKRHYETV